MTKYYKILQILQKLVNIEESVSNFCTIIQAMESSAVPSNVAKAGDSYEKLDVENILREGEFVHVVVGEVYTPYNFWVIPHTHTHTHTSQQKKTSHALNTLMDCM